MTLDDPGSFLRGTVTLTATAADGAGAGVATVRIQRSPADADELDGHLHRHAAPYSCSLNTTSLLNDDFDLRAIATDAPGNTTTSDLAASTSTTSCRRSR